jgi:hypothetical protein
LSNAKTTARSPAWHACALVPADGARRAGLTSYKGAAKLCPNQILLVWYTDCVTLSATEIFDGQILGVVQHNGPIGCARWIVPMSCCSVWEVGLLPSQYTRARILMHTTSLLAQLLAG